MSMADRVNEFRFNESFTEKVMGFTVFEGKVVVAREDGVFMLDGDVFRRVAIDQLNAVIMAFPPMKA